jgi:aldose 1-epimerase
MSVRTTPFGALPDGTPVRLFTLTNAHGLAASITDYGATITALLTPDRAGRLGDIVLGFDDVAGYLGCQDYIGCTIGRVAGRIAGGRFALGGRTHQLTVNNGPNHLHGGRQGLDKVCWHGEALPGPVAGVTLRHSSPDGHEGYPGRLDITVVMTLTDADELIIDYTARSDEATPVNLTNHSYFNLSGQADILGHELTLAASSYIPTDDNHLPTGAILPVRGTPFDFTRPTLIGARLDQLTGTPRGYDQTFVLERNSGAAARVHEPMTGRVVELTTSEPGVHLYTANFFDGTNTGKWKTRYGQYAGLALEAQHFPDSVNQPGFPGTILQPGETYRQTTSYKFSVG